MVRKFCLSLAILESVSLANVIWYWCNETGTDGLMMNNAIFVLFNTNEFHKMAAPIKSKSHLFNHLCDYAIDYINK